ncbi:SprT-like family-domain-containing protein [Mycena sp. CBHHK59/15]|nr:SprT-like family-domain-containing protein [Mycena sp. CBHHK59/15]
MPSPIKSPTKQKRLTKKAQQLAERIQREEYAKEVYVDLNSRVFENGLPSLTAVDIIWNPRMTATAGQAKYHMNRNGVESATIQLATKILDCDERIRNTLSHEMCHLACWMIDRNTDEAHGKLFKAWARKVEDEDPDITVSVTHNYAIYYPFTWGTFRASFLQSESTQSCSECVDFCPNACKSGKMLPLFDAPKRIPRLSKISKMAAARPRSIFSSHSQNACSEITLCRFTSSPSLPYLHQQQ